MRKFITTLLFVFIASFSYSMEKFGEVPYDDLMEVGVTKENIDMAKKILDEASRKYKLLALEKKKIQIEINQLVLEDYEKNVEKIDSLFDEIGKIEATELKDQLHTQVNIQKHIKQEEYVKARMLSNKNEKK